MYENEMVRRASESQGGRFSAAQYGLVDEILSWCKRNYANGGDIVVECYEFEEILEEFDSLEDVKETVALRLEAEKNHRFGLDSDPELLRSPDNWV